MRSHAPTGQCLDLLIAMRDLRWRAPAWALNHLGMLNERGRISDLRHRWHIDIRAHTERVAGILKTTYVVQPSSRLKANRLIEAGLISKQAGE